MPISDDLSPRSFVTKITKYERVVDIPNSMTVLTDLLPISIAMTVAGKTVWMSTTALFIASRVSTTSPTLVSSLTTRFLLFTRSTSILSSLGRTSLLRSRLRSLLLVVPTTNLILPSSWTVLRNSALRLCPSRSLWLRSSREWRSILVSKHWAHYCHL